ncbi:unnamed protein product [Trifolium pratense]|uniref:Uncharacterized protein n=1 Tax=Trifolium pratense TaxID=57577 RepID=A0ACB0M5F1_TRIPR|nr:unnamed protein product [Trifolium pratense]
MRRRERCSEKDERAHEMRRCGEKDETRGTRRKFMGQRRFPGTETSVEGGEEEKSGISKETTGKKRKCFYVKEEF